VANAIMLATLALFLCVWGKCHQLHGTGTRNSFTKRTTDSTDAPEGHGTAALAHAIHALRGSLLQFGSVHDSGSFHMHLVKSSANSHTLER
jgi:hypothetical protein